MGELGVITGVSRGIGHAAALALAERGIDLALLGRASEAHTRAVDACRQRGVTVTSYELDLSDGEAVTRTGEQIAEVHGAPRVVLNNAARLERGPLVQQIDPAVWDDIMAVNLRAPFLLTRALLPSMLRARRGRLLHVSSISGTIGCPQMAHYGASKWGLLGFHHALSDELRGTGVQSIAILPGSVETDMLAKTPFPADMAAADVARVIVYHALDAPDAMHGARVQIYG